jgi:hypothetical protein
MEVFVVLEGVPVKLHDRTDKPTKLSLEKWTSVFCPRIPHNFHYFYTFHNLKHFDILKRFYVMDLLAKFFQAPTLCDFFLTFLSQ